MVLTYGYLQMLSAVQDEKVTADEIKMIEKKSGEKTLKIFLTAVTVISLIAGIYTLLAEKEFPVFYSLVFAFFGMLSAPSSKRREISACYAAVVDKTVRCANSSGKCSVYLPYEKTVEAGTYKHRYTLFETVYDYYYCTVEINGEIYENVCCLSRDFPKIETGDRVIVANEDSYFCPVVYKIGKKE